MVKEILLLQFSFHYDLVLPHVCHLIQALVNLTARGNTIASDKVDAHTCF